MYHKKWCTKCKEQTCKPDGFDLPFQSTPFCPSATERRRQTQDCLAKQSFYETFIRPLPISRKSATNGLTVVGRKLHVGSEELTTSRILCGRSEPFDAEFRMPSCICHRHVDVKYDGSTLVHFSSPVKSDVYCNCCDDVQLSADECQSVVNDQPCHANEQRATFLNELDESCSCFETDKAEPEICATGSHRNARIDENRLLKLLRRYDRIRQRARDARQACLLRYELRQKQRLCLRDSSEHKHRQKNADQTESIGSNKPPPANDEPVSVKDITTDDVELPGARTLDIKLREIVDACGPAISDDFIAKWPQVLDDTTATAEPPDAVISRLMSQFERIRVDSVTARLENQKRYDAKRKQMKQRPKL